MKGVLSQLDHEQCKVRVLEKRTVWSETVSERIEFHYTNGHFLDKLVVTEDSAFVSSFCNDCVCVYSLSSRQCLCQIGQKGQSGQGHLSGPVIIDVDTQGCIMVCDYGNNRVQVCEGGRNRGEERWHSLTLPIEKHRPVEAVVGRDGHTIWVVTHLPYQIIKCKA